MSPAYSRNRLFAKNLGVLQNSVTLNNNFQLFKMTAVFSHFAKCLMAVRHIEISQYTVVND
jgi:hypothetical protein